MIQRLLILVISAFFLSTSFAQINGSSATATPQLRQGEIKDKYHVVEVDSFEVKQGVEFPAEYLKSLQDEVVKQLAAGKVFGEVLRAAQQPPQTATPVIRLSGNIHNYKKGSQAKRYVGYGMGRAEVDARVAFQDAATGQPLVIEELRAFLAGGVFGGKEEKVTQELARQVVTQAKLMLRRRVPAVGQNVSINLVKPTDPISAAEPDRHTLTISGKNLEEAQQKLDEEAAQGYRVVDMSLSGSSTADLELEKLAAPPEVYQYRWVHMRMARHLQRDVNNATADGFHACPHTLAWLGPFLSVLMERPPVASATHYEYLATQPLRMSSAQKDTETHEGEGYTLLDETDAGPVHILLFEKAIEEAGVQETIK